MRKLQIDGLGRWVTTAVRRCMLTLGSPLLKSFGARTHTDGSLLSGPKAAFTGFVFCFDHGSTSPLRHRSFCCFAHDLIKLIILAILVIQSRGGVDRVMLAGRARAGTKITGPRLSCDGRPVPYSHTRAAVSPVRCASRGVSLSRPDLQ